VFDGSRGNYSEDDVPSPVNVYAASKLAGEREVRELMPMALVVRTNFIGMNVVRGAGLADWIATSVEQGTPIKGFADVIFSPLLATTLAERLFEMMDARLTGLYHLGASDSISKYDLALTIAREMGHPEAKIERVSLADMQMKVRRPLNTSLVSKRAEAALKTTMPTVLDAVKGFIAERQEIIQSTVAG
jgi:dTDP-4-dehydrorhamnose reductase